MAGERAQEQHGPGHGFIEQDMVENEFQRPGFQEIHAHAGKEGEISQEKPPPVRSHVGGDDPVYAADRPEFNPGVYVKRI